MIVEVPRRSLQAELDALRAEADASPPPGGPTDTEAAAMEAALVRTRGIRPLREGDRAPDFVLPEARGAIVRLGDLLALGPVVLAFYRGVW
jgi:hypothetical protein